MIEIERAGKRFGDILAVDDVSLTIERGTITALVGASGSGKSTLLRMINRLIAPTSGTIRIDGVDTATVAPNSFVAASAMRSRGTGCFRTGASRATSRPCRACSAGRPIASTRA